MFKVCFLSYSYRRACKLIEWVGSSCRRVQKRAGKGGHDDDMRSRTPSKRASNAGAADSRPFRILCKTKNRNGEYINLYAFNIQKSLIVK